MRSSLRLPRKEFYSALLVKSNSVDHSRTFRCVHTSPSGCCTILCWWSDHRELDEIRKENLTGSPGTISTTLSISIHHLSKTHFQVVGWCGITYIKASALQHASEIESAFVLFLKHLHILSSNIQRFNVLPRKSQHIKLMLAKWLGQSPPEHHYSRG